MAYGGDGKNWNREKRQPYKLYGKVTDVLGEEVGQDPALGCACCTRKCAVSTDQLVNQIVSEAFCVMWGNQNMDCVYNTRKFSACQWCIYLCL